MEYQYITGALILLVGFMVGYGYRPKKNHFLTIKLNKMSEQLDAIKAKLTLQDTAIDGLAGDLAFIKGKLAGAEGGLTADEVAELNALIDARTAKLQALDAETDPSQG
jgi:hypothetical protein